MDPRGWGSGEEPHGPPHPPSRPYNRNSKILGSEPQTIMGTCVSWGMAVRGLGHAVPPALGTVVLAWTGAGWEAGWERRGLGEQDAAQARGRGERARTTTASLARGRCSPCHVKADTLMPRPCEQPSSLRLMV